MLSRSGFVTRRAICRLRCFCVRSAKSNLKVANITCLMKGDLTGQFGDRSASAVVEDRDLTKKFWLRTCPGMAITTRSNARLFRVFRIKFCSKGSCSVRWPSGLQWRNSYKFGCRLSSVMTFGAQYRPTGIVFAAVVALVVECDRSLLSYL